MAWTTDKDGIWNTPEEKIRDMILEDDPIHAYERTALFDDVMMRIVNAPCKIECSNVTDGNIVIAHEEQSDTGANANITPHVHLLHDIRWFEPVTIGNAQRDSTLQVKAIGTFHLQTSDGIKELHMYYSPNASNTIVSPTAICRQYPDLIGFHQWSNINTHQGQLQFVNGDNDTVFGLQMSETNGLCYHSQQDTPSFPTSFSVNSIQVNALSDAAKYELWHQRLGHCGSWAMATAHKHVLGIPKLRGNSFYKCASCMNGKLCTKRSNVKRNRTPVPFFMPLKMVFSTLVARLIHLMICGIPLISIQQMVDASRNIWMIYIYQMQILGNTFMLILVLCEDPNSSLSLIMVRRLPASIIRIHIFVLSTERLDICGYITPEAKSPRLMQSDRYLLNLDRLIHIAPFVLIRTKVWENLKLISP